MTNFVEEGCVLDYTAGGAITSGQVVIDGQFIGIASKSGVSGDVIAVNLKGVYTLAKDTSTAITKGDKLFWSVADSEITKVATDKPIGIAWTAAGSSDTSVQVKLDTSNVAPVAAFVAFTAGTNLVGVDGTGSNAAPLAGTETRLDSLDTAVGAIKTALINAGLMASS